MSKGLVISSHEPRKISTDTLHVGINVALARGAVDDSRREVGRECERAFEVHMQVFAYALWSRVPSTHSFSQRQGQGVNRCWNAVAGAAMKAREACATPKHVC